ncbi:MAG: DUF4231 domain-containing protein [Bacteroidales bacterium]|jgi:hypothetical protein|nr:DUF4231 domain-containing protein [Bacteroidales bacterium]
MNQEEYLANRVDDQIYWYDGKSQKAQKNYKRLKIAEMVCSASIPILVAFWNSLTYIPPIVALLGAVVTVIAGIHGLYNFHENWIEYRSTAETLKHEKFMYLTQSGIYKDNENAFYQFVERVESIISHENTNWAQLNVPEATKSCST